MAPQPKTMTVTITKSTIVDHEPVAVGEVLKGLSEKTGKFLVAIKKAVEGDQSKDVLAAEKARRAKRANRMVAAKDLSNRDAS